MADNDVQLDLKKRARRRLVGAIAMALLAAIILPNAMESKPEAAESKFSGKELQIRIPSQEGSNFASRLIASPPPAPKAPTASTQSAPPATQAPSTLVVEPSLLASAAPAIDVSVSVSTPRASTTKEVSSSKSSPKPTTEAQRAREILEGKPVSRDAAAQQFYVQLGVFRDEANAREVLSRATASGVKAASVKVEGKSRVRAGPFSERVAADLAVAKLKKAGLSGIVTSK